MRLWKVDGRNGNFFARINRSNNDRGNVICYLYWFSYFIHINIFRSCVWLLGVSLRRTDPCRQKISLFILGRDTTMTFSRQKVLSWIVFGYWRVSSSSRRTMTWFTIDPLPARGLVFAVCLAGTPVPLVPVYVSLQSLNWEDSDSVLNHFFFQIRGLQNMIAVSYTHLTLPTILLV